MRLCVLEEDEETWRINTISKTEELHCAPVVEELIHPYWTKNCKSKSYNSYKMNISDKLSRKRRSASSFCSEM